jgi:hypothetical protein
VILTTVIRAGVSAARDAARLVTTLGSHAVWWVDYRVGGRTHRTPDDPRRRPPPSER